MGKRLLLVVMVAIAGCSKDPSPGGPCQSNRDCVVGETCISGSCRSIIVEQRCTFDDDCGFGERCNTDDGLCIPIVTEDAGDASTSTMTDAGVDMDTGPRDVPDICMTDEECGQPPVDICSSQQCVKGCGQADGLQCTGGTMCNMTTGHCEAPMMSCSMDNDCVPGPPTQICINMECVIGCGLDPNLCTAAEICDSTSGQCVPRPMSCMMDSECGPPLNVCEGTQCIPGCGRVGGVQCSGATPFCNGSSGRCVATPPCTTDPECNDATRICEANNCVLRCDQPGGLQCSGATPNCNAVTGRCDATPTCNQDPDCNNADQICISQTCVTRCDRPGGITCTGATPSCDPGTGRCVPPQSCNLDADCAATEVCVNQTCNTRCELPGGLQCSPSEVCNPGTGRCIPGMIPLGASCTTDTQCQSGFCLSLNLGGNPQQFCSSPCSAGADCPLDFACAYVSGMNFCLHESLFGPPAATFDTPAGGACSDTVNTCQSGVCNTGTSQCIETCQNNGDCTSFGGQCWMWERADGSGSGNLYDHLCFNAGAGSGSGAGCAVNADCISGICNRYTSSCAQHCCRDSDCPAAQSCLGYDADATTIVKVCGPRAGSGTGAIGTICSAPTDCVTDVCAPVDPNDVNSVQRCSTACCTDADCGALPQGGRCRPSAGAIMGTISGVCFPNN